MHSVRTLSGGSNIERIFRTHPLPGKKYTVFLSTLFVWQRAVPPRKQPLQVLFAFRKPGNKPDASNRICQIIYIPLGCYPIISFLCNRFT